MNVFRKVTRQGLKKNRTRTIVTIIGVILSAAMITAVTTFISSLQDYMLQLVISTDGDWHVRFYDADAQRVGRITGDSEVETVSITETLGYAMLEGCQNPDKPYLFVSALDDTARDELPIKLTRGRMPENSGELLIPEHTERSGGVTISVGDTLTLDIGERFYAGEKLGQQTPFIATEEGRDGAEAVAPSEGETLITHMTVTYTVVGLYERPSFEDYSAPGFTALTMMSDEGVRDGGAYDMFIKLRHPRQVYTFTSDMGGDLGSSYNSDMLRYLGVSNNDSYNAVLYSLGAVFIALIMVGSILLIYNAFSISVSERTRQFGILSSVGASQKQLRGSVLYEGFCIGVIGIPIGIIAGIAGIGLTLLFVGNILADLVAGGLTMRLSVSLPSVIIAAVIGIATILISAYLPARRAARQSAIEAIRQTRDVKINPKKVRTSKLTQRLFGLEGTLATKYFKRNKRRYRSTVVSLFVSVVLFISASAFGMYLKQTSVGYVEDLGYDLSFDSRALDEEQMLRLYDEFLQVKDVTGGSYYRIARYFYSPEIDLLSDRFVGYMGEELQNGTEQAVLLIFLEDSVFDAYAQRMGLDPAEYQNATAPRAIATSMMRAYDQTEGRYLKFDIFGSGSAPSSLSLQGLWDEETDTYAELTLSVGAYADAIPKELSTLGSGIMLFAPYSQRDLYEGASGFYEDTQLIFSSDNPTKSAEAMEAILDQNGIVSDYSLYNVAESLETNRSLLLIINIFTYGFIILISLITIANVFNTISTNINLRRREFAMLKSIGMTDRGFRRMMNYECLLFGIKALLYGLPAAFGVTYLIYSSVMQGMDVPFTVPWVSVGIAVLSVFVVVFVTMLYSINKLKKENVIEALKSEII